ncbi:toxic anion resistance protein [Ureibacillus sp. 179-F W5.1 NHS]|uniref:toxic anion resistance protein n=1 Tax=Bacillales TaxID=1385 RepID=UPI001313EE0F|nr:toxic anion resistance protein [Lysinibacillus halotolerans]
MSEKKSAINPFEEFSKNGSSFFDVTIRHDYSVDTPTFNTLNRDQQSEALLIASQLDVSQYENVLRFGEEVQQKLKNFTHNMLVSVQRNDTSPIREILFKLMQHLEKVNPDDLIEKNKGFFRKLFNQPKTSLQEIATQYNRLSKQIDRLSIQLQHAQKGLLADMKLLNDLFDLNEDYFHRINLFIAAGEMKKKDLLNHDLPQLEKKASTSANPMDQQLLNDLKSSIEWLDKKIYDLQISREIAIQTAPQIRLIQQTNQMLMEKIQASVMTTIPLWQTQIAMLISLSRQQRAESASRRLMDTSEQMLRKNAKIIEASGQNKEKPITHEEIDSFKQTQYQLIESIEETLRVQAISNEQKATIEAKLPDIHS